MLAIPFQRPCPRAKAGSPRLPGDPSRDSAPFSDPGRPVAPRQSRRFRCCPHTLNSEGVVDLPISRLDSAASSPAVYASRRALPHAMQDSLPAGGLRLYRAGVEPAGSRRKVSDHLILLSRSLPGAISVRSSRDILSKRFALFCSAVFDGEVRSAVPARPLRPLHKNGAFLQDLPEICTGTAP